MTDPVSDDTGPRGRLLDLLERWQSLERQGRPATAAELCADCPELAGDLEQFAQFVRRVEGLSTASGAMDTDGPGLTPTLTPAEETARPMATTPAEERYAIEDQLGEGGMGAVYRARDRLLGRTVALKVIRPEAMSAAMRARFESEARAVARLDHPHIVKVFDVGRMTMPNEPEPVPFLTLEYVEGGSLTRQLSREPLPAAEAAHLVALLARAMQHAHDRGIVHRDLKPDNVLLAPASSLAALNTPLGCPKISDFGLAREVSASKGLTRTGAVMGTPSYMAPEQAEGLPDLGPPADVWALGVILYRLLAGKLPFESPSLVDLLHAICREEPPPLPQVQRGVPARLAAIVHDCLKKRPQDRPTAGQLADRLEGFLRSAGQPETISRLPTLEETPPIRPARRPVWLALAAGVGGLAVLSGLAWHFWPERSTEERRTGNERTDDSPAVRDGKPPVETKRVRIKPIKAIHYETEAVDKALERGRIGEQSFATRHGDAVTLTVELLESGYCYVIGFTFAGEEQLLWPVDEDGVPSEDVSPPKLDRLRLPEGEKRLYLDDKAKSGLQLYVAAASSKPLPTYAEWKRQRKTVNWKRLEAGKAVWEVDAKGTYEVVKGLGADRGSIREAAGVPPLSGLCRSLQSGGVEAVEAIAFPVLPREGER